MILVIYIVSPMCGCNAEIEDTEHFLLRFHFYSIERFKLFSNVNKVDLTQLDTKKTSQYFVVQLSAQQI